MLKSLRLKIAAGFAAAAVVVGGITAAIVIIQNQNAEEDNILWNAGTMLPGTENEEGEGTLPPGTENEEGEGTLPPGTENEEDAGTVLPAELPRLEKNQFFDTASEEDGSRLIMSVKGNPMGEFQVCATVTVTPPDSIWIADEEFSNSTRLWFRKTDDSYGILQIFGSNQEESAEEGINEEIHWNVIEGSDYETGSIVNDAGEELLWIKITYYWNGEVERYLFSFVKEYVCGDNVPHSVTYRIFSGEDEEPFAEDWLDYVSSEALVIELTPFVIETE